MAMGLPVAADAPGIPDILEREEVSGGLVIPKENSAALAEALNRVLNCDRLRRKLSIAARCRIETISLSK